MPGNGAAGASYGELLMTSLLVLGGVCVAAFVIVRLFGRFVATGRARGAHLLDVVARLPLEPRRSLYVVEVAGKTLLVGTSEMGLSVLSELDGNEVRSRAVERPSFGELVRAAWGRRRSGDLGATAKSASVGADRRGGDASDHESSGGQTARARVLSGDVGDGAAEARVVEDGGAREDGGVREDGGAR